MKCLNFLLLWTICVPSFLAAQIQIFDDFSDGDFRQNPPWQGDTALFEINAAGALQLADSVAGEAYLSTASAIGEAASWRFRFRFDFNPSGSNYARFYLLSDTADLRAPLQGYFLRLGGSSADQISFFRQDGSQNTLLWESSDKLLDYQPVEAELWVERQGKDRWRISIDTGSQGQFRLLGSWRDDRYHYSRFLGWRCHYTRTRADRIYLFHVQASGAPLVDTTAPRLDSLHLRGENGLELYFNEALRTEDAENPAHYRLGPQAESPQNAQWQAESQSVLLQFGPGQIRNKEVQYLRVDSLRDRFGNASPDSLSFWPRWAEEGDIVFNELMIDPSPGLGIWPEAEYLEIYNRSAYAFSLRDYRLEVGRHSALLPDYTLAPGAFLLLGQAAALDQFPDSIPRLALSLGATALTNSGARVALFSAEGRLVHGLRYQASWYRHPHKGQGGWSLAQIDLESYCAGAENWQASEDPRGGSPGAPNAYRSALAPSPLPRIDYLSLPATGPLVLVFSSALAWGQKLDLAQLRTEPPVSWDSLVWTDFGRRLHAYPAADWQAGQVYKLWWELPPYDCSGRELRSDSLYFAPPQLPDSAEVLVNELLFDPADDGPPFVEIINVSEHFVELSQLHLGRWDADLQMVYQNQPIAPEGRLLAPGGILALSPDTASLRAQYPHPGQVLHQSQALPSLPQSGGSYSLSLSHGFPVDYGHYDPSWHMPLLQITRGVSLERLRPQGYASGAADWQSAAGTQHYATPGVVNSQYQAQAQSAGQWRAEPKLFSPNQDGYRDWTELSYRFPGPNHIANVYIHAADGRLVRALLRGQSCAPEGRFRWDGLDDEGQLVAPGIYIAVLEHYHAGGESTVLKTTCVVDYRP